MDAAVEANDLPLPVLRPDVELLIGPRETDGAPSYILHDPLHATFDRMTWAQGEIIRRLRVPTSLAGLLADLAATSTLRVEADDVRALCADLIRRGLTTATTVTPDGTPPSRHGLWDPAALFRDVAYLRIPLIWPDRFLARTLPWLRPLGSRAAAVFYLALGVVALLLLAQRWDAFVATFTYFFNAAGMVAFAVTLATVKVVHEFAHAYVAKALGNRVPKMGVTLIFLFPVAFADATDSWRMAQRRQRMWIALAGVLAELVLAAIALIVWAVSPPGVLHSVCFVLSSVTLLSTLLVNLNPAMRFDGYYVFCDLVGVDNLQGRAFAVARWLIRRYVLGMRLASPEAGQPRPRHALLALYGGYAWLYRLSLYAGIAIALYHRVTKVLGILLFALALYTFLVRPIAGELANLWRLRRQARWNPRAAVALVAFTACAYWVFWPLPQRVRLPATTVPAAEQVIYAPAAGVIAELPHGDHDCVRRGDLLVRVSSDRLDAERELAELQIARVQQELALIRENERLRPLLAQKSEELTRAVARRNSVLRALERLDVRAETDGVIVDWDPELRVGLPVGTRDVLGRVVAQTSPPITCYVPDTLAPDLHAGTAVVFRSDAGEPACDGVVTFVERVPVEDVPHRALTSVAGGGIPVASDALGRLIPRETCYAAEITLATPDAALRLGQTGSIWLRTPPRVRFIGWLNYVQRVFVREASF